MHVRAHQGAVGVIVFEEGNQGGRHGYHLARRHVHILHFRRRYQGEFHLVTHRNQLVNQTAFSIQRSRRLGDHLLGLSNGRQVLNVVSDLAMTTRRTGLSKAVAVGASVGGQRVNQTDVGTFRRFNRAYPAVVSGVRRAHQSLRAHGSKPPGPKAETRRLWVTSESGLFGP